MVQRKKRLRFIEPDEQGNDVFVVISAVQAAVDGLKEGQQVMDLNRQKRQDLTNLKVEYANRPDSLQQKTYLTLSRAAYRLSCGSDKVFVVLDLGHLWEIPARQHLLRRSHHFVWAVRISRQNRHVVMM